MGLRINTNVASINAQRNLASTSKDLTDSLEKLSSGQRINKSADDAAGLAISENLKAEIRGNQQASRNANDGVSLVQVAEGGMNEISNILIRLRELSVQAASDTVGDLERGFVDTEVQQLKSEVERISNVTRFGHTKLLNGEGGELELQVGTSNQISEDRINVNLQDINLTTSNLAIDGLTMADKANAQESMATIDDALNKVNAGRANLGAMQNRLQSTINNLMVSQENLAASNSRIRDADIAAESSKMIKSNILQQAGTSVLAQANNATTNALKLVG